MTKTNEEDEAVIFKLYVSFSADSSHIRFFSDTPLIALFPLAQAFKALPIRF